MSSFLPYGFVATVLTRFGVAELMCLLSRMSYKAKATATGSSGESLSSKTWQVDARRCQVMPGVRCTVSWLRASRCRSVPKWPKPWPKLPAPLSASQCSGFRRGHIGFCGGGIYFALSPQAQHQCMMKRNQKDHRNSFPSFLILRESVDHIFLSEHVSADCIRVDPFMNPYRLTPMKNLMAVHIVKAMFFFFATAFFWGTVCIEDIWGWKASVFHVRINRHGQARRTKKKRTKKYMRIHEDLQIESYICNHMYIYIYICMCKSCLNDRAGNSVPFAKTLRPPTEKPWASTPTMDSSLRPGDKVIFGNMKKQI